ncbi:MAG: tetratricopeptide repeat protein, partial [Spirochaetota bacterium]
SGPEIPAELASEIPDVPSMDAIDDVVASEPIPDIPEPAVSAFGSFASEEPESSPAHGGGADLSDNELRRLKNAIMLFSPELMRAVKNAILNDMLPEGETRILVDMILRGRDDEEIQRYLEDKLGRKIAVSKGTGKRRRVVSSRPEYTTSASRERQKKILKWTKIGGVAVLAVCALTVLGYQYVYKPMMAKKLIGEGVALILKKADVTDSTQNYGKAEELFKRVNDEYVENYLPGHNRYARAYFDRRQYARSLKKLNDAYAIQPSYLDTLNNLGFYYKKIPDAVWDEELRSRVHDMYYKKVPPAVERINGKYDVAIDFYLKAKHVDPENITALVGIGDVYFLQGQYLKARQYYESILKVDADSIAGYSGLMNLFIERDDFPDLLTVYVERREKDLLEKIPSPLLGKLAEYLLSKSADGDRNVRIEYGIMSDRIKDDKDNLFPAVRVVLNALHSRDAEYPPLYLHYAKLAQRQNNLSQVKGYLEQAIGLAEENGDQYFGALTMLGDYYYAVKDPMKAYAFYKKADAAHINPASFTQDDFYSETEQIGRTYTMMGNIFYYYFDRVSARFGDAQDEAELEEDAPDTASDQMLNYEIAMKKYELAAAEGFSSPELNYNLGRIYYLKGLYDRSVTQWLNLYEDFTTSPELIFALGNAFYHLNNTESAKAEFQKLINVYEHEAERTNAIVPSRRDHRVMFGSLASS